MNDCISKYDCLGKAVYRTGRNAELKVTNLQLQDSDRIELSIL